MLLRILTISLAVGIACAATYQEYLPPKPKELAHKEGCYIRDINDVIPFGQQATPIGKNCYRVECTRGMLYYASCGVVAIGDPKCHVTDHDLTKPYPDCCPDIRCEVDSIDNNNIDLNILKTD